MARKNKEKPLKLERIEVNAPWSERIRGRLAKVALCGVLLAEASMVGGMSEDLWNGVDARMAQAPAASPEAAASTPARKECPPVPPEALKLARHLVTYGEKIPQLRAAEERKRRLQGDFPETPYDFQTLDYQRYQGAAEKHGLTVHDVRPYMQKLRPGYDKTYDQIQGGAGEYEQPFDTYLEQANQFLSLYGVEITVVDELNEIDEKYNLRPPGEADLEARYAKEHIRNIMEDFASFPEEFIRQVSGLREIRLLAGERAEVAAYAVTSGSHDMIGYNISKRPDYYGEASTLMHELYHLVDAELCGGPEGMDNDPAYTKHNAAPYIDKKDGIDPRWTFEDIRQGADYDDYIDGATSIQDYRVRICRARKAVETEHANQSFFDDYAAESLVEDKADTGSRILHQDGLDTMTDLMAPPRVTAKYEVLLGRLAQTSPKLARYFTAIQAQPGLYKKTLSSCKRT